METGKMEMNLNEMENACGGGLWDTIQMKVATELEKRRNALDTIVVSVATEIEKRKVAGQSDVRAYGAGGFDGTAKGIWRVIIGG